MARARIVALARVAKPGGQKRPAVIVQVKRGIFGRSTYHPVTFRSYAAREKFLHPKRKSGKGKFSAKQLRAIFAKNPSW